MNIGFDLDKIFINYPPFIPDSVIDSLYKEKSDGILSYRIPSKIEQMLRFLSHYPPLRPPIMANIEFVKQNKQKNNDKYYLISSRFNFLKGRTQAITKKYQFDTIFDSMFFNYNNEQPHMFKERILRKLLVDRYVDDDLQLLRYLTLRNPKVDFYWLNGKKAGTLENNLFAITRLSAIIQ